MILVADSGSSKTDWLLALPNQEVKEFRTAGLNPYFLTEKEIVKSIYDFESVVEEAGATYSPALIANYVYELTKLYNRFYHDYTILKEENVDVKNFRLQLSEVTAKVISAAMRLLGITVPERM